LEEAPVTNEEAILRLARDTDDSAALLAIVENNSKTLYAAIKRHFSDRTTHKNALITLVIRISWRAKYFIAGHDNGDRWIADCAELECRRLHSEVRGVVSTVGRTTHAVN
jgi:hypothetical protein